MAKSLVIVESPAKARTINKIVGDKYIVEPSMGHVVDLPKRKLGIDLEANFKPSFVVIKEKKKTLSHLKKMAKSSDKVYIATDPDREGEAIGWHIKNNISGKQEFLRVVFHEITKEAVSDAFKHPAQININKVNAQATRRVLDRLVGYLLSPLLWKHIANAMSAGRVQSVTTRLIIDKEQVIEKFNSNTYYKTSSIFKNNLEGDLDKNFKDNNETKKFLNDCIGAQFNIENIEIKKVKRFPSAPFRTSTMQQEAGRKLNMSAKMIMNCAQTLYENGYITYHRTDCVDISPEALTLIKDYILDKYGKKYLNIRKYKTKVKDAQEAHECIRPNDINRIDINDTDLTIQHKKLYEIIWKKTISSQMSPCEVDIYMVSVNISNRSEKFICKAEKITFKGYKIVYDYKDVDIDEDDKDSQNKLSRNLKIIDTLKIGQVLNYKIITSTEKFTKATPRFTEATLTKKMEELGIGRPATTASIITTIQDRKYVVKESRKGEKVSYKTYILQNDNILKKDNETVLNTEKNKLFPTELGRNVNDFLLKNFPDILDYEFTSKIESELDEIAKGKKIWNNVVKNVYDNYHPNVEKLNSTESKVVRKEIQKKLVGKENKTGKSIYAYIGKFGPVLQIGTGTNKGDVRFVSIKEEYSIDSITEEEANNLLKYPKNLGKLDGKDIYIKEGKFGLYLNYNGKNYSINDEIDKNNITLEEAIELIKLKDDKTIKVFNKNTKIMNGPYGPFIIHGKKIAPIPKSVKDPSKLTLNDCAEFVKIYKK